MNAEQLRLPRTGDIDMQTLRQLSFEHGICIPFLVDCVELGLDVENMTESEMWRAWSRAHPKPPGGDDCAET